MAEIEITREDEGQAEALDRALAAPRAEALDVCAIWKIAKPFWPWLVGLVSKIPKVGGIIGKVLELIGKALDQYCNK